MVYANKNSLKTFGFYWLCGLSVSTSFCLYYIQAMLQGDNARYMFWNYSQLFSITLLILLLATILSSLVYGLHRLFKYRLKRLGAPLFFIFLASIVVFNLPLLRIFSFDFRALRLLAKVLLFGGMGTLVVCSLFFIPLQKAAKNGWKLTAAFSVLAPILFLSLCQLPTWQPEKKLEDGITGNPAIPPVLILLPDMIGYADITMVDGSIRPDLPTLREFSETAILFTEAHSPGDFTRVSIPGLILQRRIAHDFTYTKEGVIWTDAYTNERFRQEDAPFSLPVCAKNVGMRTWIKGNYLPLPNFFPIFDVSSAGSHYGPANRNSIFENMVFILKSVMEHHKRSVNNVAILFGIHHNVAPIELTPLGHASLDFSVSKTTRFLNEIKEYIQHDFTSGDFAILHLPIPHYPYMFDENGQCSPYSFLDERGYHPQLVYTDTYLNQIFQFLKTRELWDASLIIVGSDHGRHYKEYQSPDEKLHVPLLIKMPYQTEPQIHTNVFHYTDLHTLILPVIDPANTHKE